MPPAKQTSDQIHSGIDRLFSSNPFDNSKESQAFFRESFVTCAEVHYKGNSYFRGLWDLTGIKPADIKSEHDLTRVPPIMVNLFKEHELITGSPDDVVLNLTSSGTSGQKSQILLDHQSLLRVKKLAWMIHDALGMTSEDEVNYLCFTYDPKVATNLGTAFTDELLTSFTKKNEVYYAIQWDQAKNDFSLNVKGVIETLERYAASPKPVRILGFPAHLYKIVRDNNIKLRLPTNSWIQTGGGWKGFANEEVPKSDFRNFMTDRLGIPASNNRDMFGMVEHGIPYCDCSRGHLHIPNYARVYIRSPKDFSVVSNGDTGLIHFLCSYVTSYPSISLLTTDYGRIGECDCGIGGPTLEILGRAGVHKHKGCALTASKLLDETPGRM